MNTRTRIIAISALVLAVMALLFIIAKKNIGPVAIPPRDHVATDKNDVQGGNDPLVSHLAVPEGFAMNVFARNIEGARVIEFDNKGRMLVSQTSEGKISVLEDSNNDGSAESVKSLVTGLNKPHGMEWDCSASEKCLLFVAEHNAVSRYVYDLETATLSEKKKLVSIPASPGDRHFTRTLLRLDPPHDNILLISVGSSCNVCNEDDAMRGRIMSYDIFTGTTEEYARGLRNAVFMAKDESGKVYATEMGRDGLGDAIPPDEINIIEKGKNYGWPTCYGKNIHDTEFDKNTYIRNPCDEPFETPSFADLEAHSAPLGIAVAPSSWTSYKGDLFVAYHGSWNRSTPTGYKIALIRLSPDGTYSSTEDFITGWLTKDGTKLGRPADVKISSNGTMYISDDMNGAIYRLVP